MNKTVLAALLLALSVGASTAQAARPVVQGVFETGELDNMQAPGPTALPNYQHYLNKIKATFTGDPASVPKPSTMFLLGAGLAGLRLVGKRAKA